MYAIDFEYDDICLSDFRFIICRFDYSGGSVSVDAGSKLTFEKVSRQNGTQHGLASAKYAECIQTTFDICKDPDFYDFDEREITNDEYRDLKRWLNRKQFHRFQVMYDGEDKLRDACFYNASFNIDKIEISEKLYGLRLTMESDKPFGYGIENVFNLVFSNSTDVKTIFDRSDEIGYTYPDITITCAGNGDLSIYNDFTDCTMLIKNCSAGETITINGCEQIISTSYSAHNICEDFNYNFLTIGNTISNRRNNISASLPCNIVLKYSPIIKDTP